MRTSQAAVYKDFGNLWFGCALAGCQLSGLEAKAGNNKRPMNWHGAKSPTCGRCSGGNPKAIAS